MFVSLVQSIVGRKDAEIAAVMSTMHHCARPLYCNVMSNWRWRDAEIPSPKTNPPSITNRLISGTNLKLHWTVVPFQTDLSLHLPISRLYSIISSWMSAVPFRSWHFSLLFVCACNLRLSRAKCIQKFEILVYLFQLNPPHLMSCPKMIMHLSHPLRDRGRKRYA